MGMLNKLFGRFKFWRKRIGGLWMQNNDGWHKVEDVGLMEAVKKLEDVAKKHRVKIK